MTAARRLCLAAAGLLLVACHDHDGTGPTGPTEPVTDPRAVDSDAHTLLVYMTGDKTGLSGYLLNNARACAQGMMDTQQPFNLVVYKDTDNETDEKNLPVLFQLRVNETGEKVDTICLRRWQEEVNSVDTAFMTEVMTEVFTRFDTPVKGVCFGSHGLGWMPSGTFVPTKAAATAPTPTRTEAYFGQDEGHYMEIWDLRAALERGPHLDYIIFDDCFMANAESAYELRHATDYIVGCPTEVMGAGFPYLTMTPTLAACQTKAGVRTALMGVVDDFADAYGPSSSHGGTIALLATEGIEALADSYQRLVEAHAADLETWAWSPSAYEQPLQHYGRAAVGTRYCFYDLAGVAQALDAEAATACLEALQHVVVKEYHSAAFTPGYESIDLERCHGLSVSVPAFFALQNNGYALYRAYPYCEWGSRMGM